MPIYQSQTDSFKVQLLNGQHNFSANTFKIALYAGNASISNSTTAYTTTGEVTGAGYTAGGNTLTVNQTPTNYGNVAYVSFANTSWSNSTVSAAGALIYNTSNANAVVCVLDFGGDKTATAGTFTVQFPADTTSAAILRISG